MPARKVRSEVYDQNGNLLSFTEEDMPLVNELSERGWEEMKRYIIDAVGGLPLPTTIDSWNTRYDPLNAVNAALTRAGITPSTISLLQRRAIGSAYDFTLKAVLALRTGLFNDLG